MASAVVSQLPWSASAQENQRFTRISWAALGLTCLLAVWVYWVELPERPRLEQERIPPQLTKILQAKLPPPKPLEPPKPEPKIEPEPEVKKPIEPKVQPEKPKPVAVKPAPTQAELAEQAKAKAKQTGVLAHADALAALRNKNQVNNQAQTELHQGAGQASQTQRNFVGKVSATASNGINTAALSTDVGAAGELAGRKTTEFVAAEAGLPSLAQQQQTTDDGVRGGRSIESIRQVLDANKSRIYAIYRRALREDPSLQGKVQVRLVIEPDGRLSSVELLSSELKQEELEAKLLSRIRMIEFGAAAVDSTVLEYTFNFLPQ